MLKRINGLALAALLGVLAAYGCGSDDSTSPTPAANTIDATPSLTFTPATLQVAPGATVTFAFGSVAHNVFFTPQTGAPADIPGNNANTSVTRVFATAGSYQYTCHIHPSMQGTVVVQ
jgi:plastocyanin